MENKMQLMSVDKLPVIEEAFSSIENMEKFCNKILESKLAPDHFYPKLPGSNDRDYTKGNTAAVMMVLIHGNQLHLPVLTSLQQIVPVNGLLSIKGDGAKGMILGSGKVQVNTWNEIESGSIEEGTYNVTISAERSDTHEKLSRTFSVAQAKRAGLWITEAQVNGQDGWKWKKSSWYKFPDRMVKYRALGFLARDLFPDVMAGTYTTEEAMDMPRDTAEVIETESGAKITIPDKEHSQKRSGKLTERVVGKLNEKFTYNPAAEETQYTEINTDAIPGKDLANGFEDPLRERIEESGRDPATVLKAMSDSVFKPERGSIEMFDGKIINEDIQHSENIGITKEGELATLTLESMEKMDTKLLLGIINKDTDMIEAMNLIPGKNTNKKLREIIASHQAGRLTEYVASVLPHDNEENQETTNVPDDSNENKTKKAELIGGELDGATNKYGITIPEFDKGQQRDFATMKDLFNLMVSVIPPVNNPRYMKLAAKMGIFHAYADREQFCKFATVKEINQLLNQN
jgi:hypothetical protein